MNQNERIKIGEMWIGIAAMFGKEISSTALKIMLDAISDLPFEKTYLAMNDWVKSSKQSRHPFPAELRSLVNPQLEDLDQGKLLASKINEAVSKFGYSNYAKAMEYIGPIGKKVVDRFGGWSYLCENLGSNIQTGMFIAQARDVIAAMTKEEMIFNENQIEYKKNENLIEGGLQKVDFGTLVSKIEKKYNEK